LASASHQRRRRERYSTSQFAVIKRRFLANRHRAVGGLVVLGFYVVAFVRELASAYDADQRFDTDLCAAAGNLLD